MTIGIPYRVGILIGVFLAGVSAQSGRKTESKKAEQQKARSTEQKKQTRTDQESPQPKSEVKPTEQELKYSELQEPDVLSVSPPRLVLLPDGDEYIGELEVTRKAEQAEFTVAQEGGFRLKVTAGRISGAHNKIQQRDIQPGVSYLVDTSPVRIEVRLPDNAQHPKLEFQTVSDGRKGKTPPLDLVLQPRGFSLTPIFLGLAVIGILLIAFALLAHGDRWKKIMARIRKPQMHPRPEEPSEFDTLPAEAAKAAVASMASESVPSPEPSPLPPPVMPMPAPQFDGNLTVDFKGVEKELQEAVERAAGRFGILLNTEVDRVQQTLDEQVRKTLEGADRTPELRTVLNAAQDVTSARDSLIQAFQATPSAEGLPDLDRSAQSLYIAIERLEAWACNRRGAIDSASLVSLKQEARQICDEILATSEMIQTSRPRLSFEMSFNSLDAARANVLDVLADALRNESVKWRDPSTFFRGRLERFSIRAVYAAADLFDDKLDSDRKSDAQQLLQELFIAAGVSELPVKLQDAYQPHLHAVDKQIKDPGPTFTTQRVATVVRRGFTRNGEPNGNPLRKATVNLYI